MKRQVARQIISAMRKMDRLFHEIHLLSEQVENETEKKALRRGLATLMHESHVGITLIVTKQFPEMHPDKDGNRVY